MGGQDRNEMELLRGTLDMLILKTLLLGPAHGHQIARQHTAQHRGCAPGGARLTLPGFASVGAQGLAVVEMERPRRERELKYCPLTATGKKELTVEESKWKRLVTAIARVGGQTES